MNGLESLETRVAHLMRGVEDLSDVVAAQAREIDRLTRRVQMLMEREAEREAGGDAGGAAGDAVDQPPPHW